MSSRSRKAAKAAATTQGATGNSTESGAPVVAGAPSAPNSSEQPTLPGIDDEPPVEGSVVVAHGRSVTTRSRGIVSAGDVVTADDFSSGDVRIEQLVEAGYLVRS